jgi:hypothetical protein
MTLSLTEMQEAVSHVSFRDWSITVLQSHFEGPILCVLIEMPDSRGFVDETTLDIHSHVPPLIQTVSDFYVWLKWRLDIIAIHEVGEDFRVDSVAIFDPHAEDALLPTSHRDYA